MGMFTIATKTNECYGHGAYGEELRICKEGAYGEGKFPPLFSTKEKAEDYLKALFYSSRKCAVELEAR